MPRRLTRWAAGSAAFLAAACAAPPKAGDLAGGRAFVLERDLTGKAVGRGRTTTITGVDRSFTVYLDGIWDEATATLTLIEDFEWDDGEEYRRTWVLSRQANGDWSGGREDTVGSAVGYQDGDVFRLRYDLRLASGTVVTLRDVFTTNADGVVVNRAVISKYGLRVGRVELEVQPSAGNTASPLGDGGPEAWQAAQ